MDVLVVGSGGREHALCWRLSRGSSVRRVYCAPGNPGTGQCAENVPIAASDLQGLTDFARKKGVDLTVVGPEDPLCAGIQERFARYGLPLAGPSAAAARLEGSKAFAKEFMYRHGIPTAPFGVYEDPSAAVASIDDHEHALVVKADGLAAGKGVFVCADADEAKTRVKAVLGGALGAAGSRVVVEQRLFGEEASFIVLTDSEAVCPLASSQDHKAVFDGDQGPNTGGMGAYSPAPVLDAALQQRVMDEIVLPTIRGMAEEGNPYRGVLYVGLMVVQGKPYVLEFNCRFGDPETQPLMARFDDDLAPFLAGVAEGELPPRRPRWDPRAAMCVVMASAGYPGNYRKGLAIEGLEQVASMEDLVVFHAGTALQGDSLVTAGGRVLGVTALGDGIAQARDRAYRAVELLRWEGVHYRKDIGYKALGS